MRKILIAVSAATALFVGGAAKFTADTTGAFADARTNERSFAFAYEVQVPGDPIASGASRLWIPLPQSDEHQSVHKLSLESQAAYSKGVDKEYGNSFAVFAPTAQQRASGYSVTLKFEVTRREFAKDTGAMRKAAAHLAPATGKEPMLRRYLEPDKLVPLNATIAALAKEQTQGVASPVDKAHHIYNYVTTTMHYDKTGDGWGRGDEMWACDSKRGNCTDFHSVLIGMLRSSGIPARFEIGFPLPEGKTEGDISGYHCWAEFYIQGIGWIPVDASEASKNPAKRDYFFGAVDADRVRFSYGRDIRLSTEQKGEPLNFFVYPYAESNGQPIKGLKTHFSFKDVNPGNSRGGGS